MRNTISKSFLRGYLRVFNLQQTKDWPDISNGRQKDFEALRSDWENVGTYIRKGIKRESEGITLSWCYGSTSQAEAKRGNKRFAGVR